MIDSHTHLEVCDQPDTELVAEAALAGVDRIVTIGMNAASNRAALAAAEAFPQVWAAVGRHPNAAHGFDDADAADLRALAAHPRCVAIGETGLDFFRDTAPRADQERAFAAQIAIARESGRALVIHSREAGAETVRTLAEQAEGVRVILHCFSMPEQLDACLEHPAWWFSFAGNVTYPKNEALRDVARRVPLERLLVETDAPFLTPQPVRKHRNQPAFVAHTAARVAEERGITYTELEAAVERNAAEVFGW
jgi:TatD DNase family protein